MTDITPKPNFADIGKRLILPQACADSAKFTSLLASDEGVLNNTFSHYQQQLVNDQRAKQYLACRGIDDERAIAEFRLGFANRSLGKAIKALPVTDGESMRGVLERLGLFKGRGHELFNGAVMFPIIDKEGSITGCYGRRVTEKLNSRSLYYVHWHSYGAGFFNIQGLEDATTAILCKSPIDALSWWVHGFKQAISTVCGYDFNNEHANLLKQSSIKTLYLALGTSKHALIESRRIAQLFKQSALTIKLIIYPDGMDANDFMLSEEHPQSAFEQLEHYAVPFVEN